jgi:hypothetical protein
MAWKPPTRLEAVVWADAASNLTLLTDNGVCPVPLLTTQQAAGESNLRRGVWMDHARDCAFALGAP